MSVRQAQREIDSREFAEWIAFDRIQPIGPDRQDVLAGTIAATVANCAMGRRHGPAYQWQDFAPKWGGDRQRAKEQANILRTWALKAGGKTNGTR